MAAHAIQCRRNKTIEGQAKKRADPRAGSITRFSLMVKGSLSNNVGRVADEFVEGK
jgi:hypothetical protein